MPGLKVYVRRHTLRACRRKPCRLATCDRAKQAKPRNRCDTHPHTTRNYARAPSREWAGRCSATRAERRGGDESREGTHFCASLLALLAELLVAPPAAASAMPSTSSDSHAMMRLLQYVLFVGFDVSCSGLSGVGDGVRARWPLPWP